MPRDTSSRQKFADYKERVARERAEGRRTDRHGRKAVRSRPFTALLRTFFRLLGEHQWTVIAALGTLTVSTLLGLIPLYAPKLVVDNVLGSEPMPAWAEAWLPAAEQPRRLLVALVVVVLSITALSVAVGLWGRWQATRVSKRMQSDVRRRVFEHASRLPLHRVYEMKSGGVAGILRDDAGAVGPLIFSMLYNPWRAIIQFLGTLLVLTWVDWRLLMGGLLILPIVWITHRTWINRIRPMFRDVRRSRREIDGHATEVFGGMRVVRALGQQRAEASSFVTRNHLMLRQELNTWWWMRGIDTAWAIIIPVASALLLLYGGWRILEDRELVAAGEMVASDALTVGDLVVFLSYLAALLGPVATLAATAASLQNDLAALDRTLDLLEEDREMPAPPDAITIEPARVEGRITFENVDFTYPGGSDEVLHGINFEAAPGRTVALVGPSGAGKTTLCNLVARFYDPDSGSVLLDGTDLTEIEVESYRRLLGVVEQDVFLFDGTIAQNIAYHATAIDEERMVEAARQANAHEFITGFADGYETLIGERGVKLSGGQRQRLAIARALFADPQLLILDEATSNLDTESERLIQQSLENLLADRTCFVIAHRLSTITHADLILVIDNGRIIERGTHDELMAAGGRYETMVEQQLTRPAGPVEAS